MKKIILLFFILTNLLFSTDEFISSNGKISFKYNNQINRATRVNENMGTDKSDISTIQIGIYYNGNYYLLSNYITSKKFIPKTNIFQTIAKLPFGIITTKYIPSMVNRESFYIINEYKIEDHNSISFVYEFDMVEKNGVIKYKKNKDYYKYNENIYIKNLKNLMTGYIIPASNLEGIKLKKIEKESIKYRNQKLIMVSKTKDFDNENSDIIQVSYRKEPYFLAFESSENLIKKEKEYWDKWLLPLPFATDEKTKEIVERFLIYLKSSTDGYSSYTNIGLKEKFDIKATLYTAIVFIKYGYLDDAKNIFERIYELETEFSYLKDTKLTETEIQDVYMYLIYLKSLEEKEYKVMDKEEMVDKIQKLVNKIKEDQNQINMLDRGYEFKIYYSTYNFLVLYREISGDTNFLFDEVKLKNYILENFVKGDGVKKYRLDKEVTYSKWEFPLLYKGINPSMILEALHKESIFSQYPYFSRNKIVDIDKNLSVLDGFYKNNLTRYGDINLLRLNEDIEENNMRIPNKIYLKGGKKYQTDGIDIYLTSKYLNIIYERGDK